MLSDRARRNPSKPSMVTLLSQLPAGDSSTHETWKWEKNKTFENALGKPKPAYKLVLLPTRRWRNQPTGLAKMMISWQGCPLSSQGKLKTCKMGKRGANCPLSWLGHNWCSRLSETPCLKCRAVNRALVKLDAAGDHVWKHSKNVFCWLQWCGGQGRSGHGTFLLHGHSMRGTATHSCAIPPLLLSQKPCWELMQGLHTKLQNEQLGQGFYVLCFGVVLVLAKVWLKKYGCYRKLRVSLWWY